MSKNPPKQDYRTLLQNALVTLEKMKSRVEAAEGAQHAPLAIVGMGCRFPGGGNDPDSFWEILVNGTDAISEVPPERWDIEAYYDPDPNAPGKMYTRWGGFLDDVDRFDPEFFGIAPREAVSMDPQQRLLLEVTWEALEDAGRAGSDLSGSATGVFVGITGNDYAQLALKAGDAGDIDAHFGSGIAHSVAAGRISYLLGLMGPAVAVDTACSSSLVAVHQACRSLRAGECEMAVAGGVNLILSPDGTISTSQSRMMSFDGRCKTFDAAADGYVRADGCAMIVLKRLSDAVAAGDHIHAVILGTALNQDGRSNGLTAPNGKAQEAVIESALADAGVAPGDVSFVETHGTGTELGDPIEVRALGAVFADSHSKDDPLMIGSVKTNVGHLEAAAGVVGLFKVVLAMQHKTIPPHLHLREPNPYIAWEDLPVTVPTEATPWETVPGKRRIAGLSSFGFSGTNSHLILAEAPPVEQREESVERPYHLLTLSAKNEDALVELARKYVACFEDNDPPLGDVCFTANAGRAHLRERLAITAAATAEMGQKLAGWLSGQDPDGVQRGTLPPGDPPPLAFLFTGQGAQYVGMGRELYETLPLFRRVLDKCDQLLRPYLEKPLLDVIFTDESQNPLLNETTYTQPALFAIEYALAQVWLSWGVRPAAVMGHSVGEFVAACVAGVFSLEDGLKLIAVRGRLMGALPPDGSMAAVFAEEATVAAAVAPYADRVSIAAVNGPTNIVISGAETAVAEIRETLRAEGVKSRSLVVSHAFHSPLMQPIVDEFEEAATAVTYHPPQIDLVSNVSGDVVRPDEITQAAYWRDHVRAPVRFGDAVQTLRRAGISVFLECGPQPTLLGMARRIPAEADAPPDVAVPSLRSGRDEWATMLHSLGLLYTLGLDVDWGAFDRDYGRRRLPLPTYPFQRQRYWMNLTKPMHRGSRETAVHPLLGQRLRSPRIRGVVYATELNIDAPSFLNDHRIFDIPLFPATAYLEMAMAAAQHGFGPGAYSVESVSIQAAMVLPEDALLPVQIALGPPADGRADFQVYSLADAEGEKWTLHASGQIKVEESAVPDPVDVAAIWDRCREEMAADAYYQRLADAGVAYGPGFRGLADIRRRDGEAIARVALPDLLAPEADQYQLHPALLDACIHLFGPPIPGAMDEAAGDNVYVPVNLGALRLYRSGEKAVWCRTTVADSEEALRGELTLFDESGEVVATLDDVQLRRVSRESLRRATGKGHDDWFYVTRWEAVETAVSQPKMEPGSWLILADASGVGDAVAAQLEAEGHRCVLVSADSLDPLQPEAFAEVVREAVGEEKRPYHGAVHLWGLDAQDEPAETDLALTYGSVLHLAQALVRQGVARGALWLVTQGAQPVNGGSPVHPTQTVLWGVANTLSQEHPELQPVCVDLDPSQSNRAGAILTELAATDGEDRIGWRENGRFAARLDRLKDALSSLSVPDAPYELVIDERGVLDNLTLERTSRPQPGPGEVEVEVIASGLNFRDVLNALGMYPGPAGPLGNECAGMVTAVGEGVQNVAPGDRVMALATRTFSRYVLTPADSVYPIPEGMSIEDAATIPLVFLTAYYGLHRLARIKAGDRVLIHAAAGGVGMAAVQLAHLAGAKVYATASRPKWDTVRQMGVEAVFNSRTLEFADQIMAATNGEGVDVVLNALAGDFIPKSLEVLADNGRFLEIGKRDVWTAEQVAELNPTLAYHVYDLGLALQENPALMREMLDDMMPHFAAGRLKPLPRHTFSIARAQEAFRFMAQAKHMGKIVVTHPNRRPNTASISPEATYLITGGLGSLGLVMAKELAACGATHIVLMGRSAPSASAQVALDELAEMGVTAVAMRGDVARRQDVARVLSRIAEEMPPLRGVIHAAGVLDDGLLLQQNWDRFATVKAPKIDGAWHLHTLTQQIPLDFFVLFSAGAALLGSSGQVNYAAANAYMDGLAHLRRAQGLPAMSINWGAWAEVGMAASLDERTRAQWRAAGVGMLPPAEGAAAFFELLSSAPAQVGVLPIDWARMAQRGEGMVKRPFFSRLLASYTAVTETKSSAAQNNLRSKLEDAPADERRDVLQSYVQEQVMRVLGLNQGQTLDVNQGLTDVGMDSLMAVELSNRLQVAAGQTLPTTLAFEYPTITALTDFLAEEVLALAAVEPEPEESVDAHLEGIMTDIEELSDSEVEDSLLKELEDAGY